MEQNSHPLFDFISESVHESWNHFSTADEFGLKMKDFYIVVYEKVGFIEGYMTRESFHVFSLLASHI